MSIKADSSQPQVVRRKSSFEEYQRRLVDKIKRHFERRRKQWEKNIENQVQHINKQASLPHESIPEQIEKEDQQMYVNIGTTAHVRLQDRGKESSQHNIPSSNPSTHPPSSKCQQIVLLSTNATGFPEENKTKYTFLVDIHTFLPFGSVMVSQRDTGIMLIGESNCASPARRKMAKAHEKFIEIHGRLDYDSLHVHTTRDGVMQIDVVATNQCQTVSS